MPKTKQLTCAVGLSTLLLAAVSCSTGDTDRAEEVSSAPPETSDAQALDADRGSAERPASLQPGRYAIPFLGASDGAPVGEVQVPAGWGQDRLLLATGPDMDPHLRRIELLAVDRVATDPCAGVLAPLDGGAAEVTAALSRQNVVRPGAPRSATVDGLSGQVVEFRVPLGLDVERCWDGQSLRPFGMDSSYTSVFPGWTYRVWVLDSEGEPLTILAAHGPGATRAEVRELTAMVEGLQLKSA